MLYLRSRATLGSIDVFGLLNSARLNMKPTDISYSGQEWDCRPFHIYSFSYLVTYLVVTICFDTYLFPCLFN